MQQGFLARWSQSGTRETRWDFSSVGLLDKVQDIIIHHFRIFTFGTFAFTTSLSRKQLPYFENLSRLITKLFVSSRTNETHKAEYLIIFIIDRTPKQSKVLLSTERSNLTWWMGLLPEVWSGMHENQVNFLWIYWNQEESLPWNLSLSSTNLHATTKSSRKHWERMKCKAFPFWMKNISRAFCHYFASQS